MPEFHAEPYIYLPAVTHKSALVAWGAFYFRVTSRGASKLVDDDDLKYVHPPRKDSIGACSAPYGPARVKVYDPAGALVSTAKTIATNHCWVTGLAPDTEYTYRVFVKDSEWAEGERWDWSPAAQALVQSGGTYDNRFRTHPDPALPGSPMAFAAIGDFGVGMKKSSSRNRQQQIADALRLAVDAEGVRLILTTGDNIYAGAKLLGIPVGAAGDEDDDWFFTYFQPYRYVINRVPVYPSIGNHDAAESEDCDDRAQVEDNFYIRERILGEEAAGRASFGPGLFYRVRYGSDIEFVCIDTSKEGFFRGHRLFEFPKHWEFVDDPAVKKMFDDHSWAWNDNPFVGTRELNGLKIVMMLLSNWDGKDRRDVARGSNTAIFEYRLSTWRREAQYLVTDWGGSMGRWGANVVTRGRWDVEGFEAQTTEFVKGVSEGRVLFGYAGQRTADVAHDIPVEHAVWFHRRAGRLTDRHFREALHAAGATSDEAARFSRALLDRIGQLGRVCDTHSNR